MKSINLIHLISEILVAGGFMLGLIPFMYLFVVWWVVPLTILNLVFTITGNDKSLPFTITNVVMAWLALIPILGIIARIVGIVMSILAAVAAGKKLS